MILNFLRLFKTTGIRVIDASVMPVIVNANTNIPTIMIGEVGSDFIRRYWQDQYLVSDWKSYVFSGFNEIEKCYYSKLT